MSPEFPAQIGCSCKSMSAYVRNEALILVTAYSYFFEVSIELLIGADG